MDVLTNLYPQPTSCPEKAASVLEVQEISIMSEKTNFSALSERAIELENVVKDFRFKGFQISVVDI